MTQERTPFELLTEYLDSELALLTNQIEMLKEDNETGSNEPYIANDLAAITTLKRVLNKMTWIADQVDELNYAKEGK